VIEELYLRGGVIERFEERKDGVEGYVIIKEAIIFERVRKPKSESEVFLKFERKRRFARFVVKSRVVEVIVEGIVEVIVEGIDKRVVEVIVEGIDKRVVR